MSADREDTCQLFNQEIVLLSKLVERLPMVRYKESHFGNPEDNLIIYNENNPYANVNILVSKYGWVKEDKLLHIDKIRYDIKLLDADSIRIEDKYLHLWGQKSYKEYEGYRREYTIDEAADLVERFLTTIPLYNYNKIISAIKKVTDKEDLQNLLLIYYYNTPSIEIDDLEFLTIKEPSQDMIDMHGEGYILKFGNYSKHYLKKDLINNHYNKMVYPIVSLD